MPQHRKGKRERETDVMEERSTTTSATTTLQGGNENHGNDSETQVMAIGPTTTSVTSTLQGGIQVGNHNNLDIIYRNCAITNITHVTHVTNNCKRCHPAEDHVVSEDTPRDLIPSSSVHTTTSVRVVDCEGRELELGDVVDSDLIFSIYTDLFINVDSEGRELGLGDVVIADRSTLWSLYTGDGMTIGVNKETRKIVHEPINVEEPFSSFSFPGIKYSPIQSVQRAKGKVGQKYDYNRFDFVVWCYTDMMCKEWLVHEGFSDGKI